MNDIGLHGFGCSDHRGGIGFNFDFGSLYVGFCDFLGELQGMVHCRDDVWL